MCKVVELVINNLDGGEHPIHMHGRRMYVIARGKDGDGNFDESMEVNNIDPIMRDSVTVAASSYIGAPLPFLLPSCCVCCDKHVVHCDVAQQLLSSSFLLFFLLSITTNCPPPPHLEHEHENKPESEHQLCDLWTRILGFG